MSEILAFQSRERNAVVPPAAARHKPQSGRSEPHAPIEAIDHHETVALIKLASAPNALWSFAGSERFNSTLKDLAARPDVTSIVLHGDAVFKDAGPDAAETATALIASVADCIVPVFAALEGDAIGPGLELALACAGRVAKEGSQFALPAVLSGQLPTPGGIQRLLTLIDVDAAARLIVFGETIDAAAALRSGLIDGMVARNVAKLAVALAQSHERSVAHLSPGPSSTVMELPSIRHRIASRAPGQAAPLAAVQAMEAAMRTPPRRSAVEIREIAARLSTTEQAHALLHSSASETALKRRRDVKGVPLAQFALRLGWPMRREAIHLLDEGASPAQIDRSLVHYGFNRGPFDEADRQGFASVFTVEGREIAADRAWLAYSPTLDFMVEAGRTGGARPGWFRRGECGALQFDPEVDRILCASALFQRLQRRRKSDEEVERRLFHGMVSGCVDLLEAHPELTWKDVDALWTTYLGFPRWRGGPLFQGAILGWEKVRAGLEAGECRRTMNGRCDLLQRWAAGDQAPQPVDTDRQGLSSGSRLKLRGVSTG
jgi:enoyl-CoA hydratase/carnithine racemase